ncbi:hypothetical protein M0R72_01120 [Candidatus Pacearchaeota archaeon]|jgi:hypothetical protein|nr:hypothetical protein [Candidatus Pacearchaeota archaeon]
MTIAQVRSDTLADLLAEFDVHLTREQLDSVSDSFAGHIEMEREQEGYKFWGPHVCDDCTRLKERVKDLEKQLADAYEGGERAVKRILGLFPDDPIAIDKHGNVERMR